MADCCETCKSYLEKEDKSGKDCVGLCMTWLEIVHPNDVCNSYEEVEE